MTYNEHIQSVLDLLSLLTAQEKEFVLTHALSRAVGLGDLTIWLARDERLDLHPASFYASLEMERTKRIPLPSSEGAD